MIRADESWTLEQIVLRTVELRLLQRDLCGNHVEQELPGDAPRRDNLIRMRRPSPEGTHPWGIANDAAVKASGR